MEFMKVAGAAQMRRLDEIAIKKYNIPGIILMENAGIGVVRAMTRHFGDPSGKKIFIICGKGNNGGDGFVIARHLKQAKADVRVLLLGKFEELTGDAAVNGSILKNSGGEISENTEKLDSKLRHSHIIVDAIFGTGLKAEITGNIKNVINKINTSGKAVVSVDIPSGISADTGKVMGAAVKAELTVTFALAKLGLFLPPGSSHCGELQIADIFIPDEAVKSLNIKTEIFTPEFLPRRHKDSYKNSFGHVLIIAGSRGMAGACCLAAMAALKTGAGLVTVAIPESLNNILQSRVIEAMSIPLPETTEGSFSKDGADILIPMLKKFDAIAIGPGISTNPQTGGFLKKIIQSAKSPLVIDADGLNLLDPKWLKGINTPVVLTPHPGEMARLSGGGTAEVERDRMGAATRFAQEHSVSLVLKGAHTLIARADGHLFINRTGNPGMATAGSGDVLTGMIVSLLAMKKDVAEALKLGVCLHGLAGDCAAEKNGENSMSASDIINSISSILRPQAELS